MDKNCCISNVTQNERMERWRRDITENYKIIKNSDSELCMHTFNLELCELSFCSDGQITCYESAAPPSPDPSDCLYPCSEFPPHQCNVAFRAALTFSFSAGIKGILLYSECHFTLPLQLTSQCG